MTVHIQLSPDTEARLRDWAAATGTAPDDLVREALEEKLADVPGSASQQPRLSRKQRVAEWLEWTASHPSLGTVADDSRDGIYSGRGE